MNPSKPAIIDTAHRVYVGYETYFFADSSSMTRFLSDPSRCCGMLTDPVSLKRFRPNRQSPSTTYNNRMYLFFSDSTKQMFDMMSDMYAYPNLKMLPKDTTGAEAG